MKKLVMIQKISQKNQQSSSELQNCQLKQHHEDNNALLALSEIKEEPPGRVAGKDTKDCSADILSASHDEGTAETQTVVELGSSSSASKLSSVL